MLFLIGPSNAVLTTMPRNQLLALTSRWCSDLTRDCAVQVFNNQETNRNSESSVVDDKTAWELYYPPFEAAVDAGGVGVMCSCATHHAMPIQWRKTLELTLCRDVQTTKTTAPTAAQTLSG